MLCRFGCKTEDRYVNTLVASAFLNNEMTRVNFNFVKDVCYLGASELANSFETSKPIGCKSLSGTMKRFIMLYSFCLTT